MNKISKNNFYTLVFVVISVGLFACQQNERENKIEDKSVTSTEESSDGITDLSNATNLVEQAKTQLAKAAKAKYEWTTTKLLISQAEKAIESGEIELAIELANKAIKESNNSLLQAKYSDEHWQDSAIN